MKILALEPHYGGSHKAFLDGWSAASGHEWTVLGLGAYKWKWRMRHGPVTLARRAEELLHESQRWDAVFCSDMLNLAEFRGLAPAALRDVPTVAYFHENQLTYPVREEDRRDLHFAYTNFTTALAAEQVWFNSAFHRTEFLDALEALLKRMPDHGHADAVGAIRDKSRVVPVGIEDAPGRTEQRQPGPLRIAWAARWEFDKNPEDFFAALTALARRGMNFRLSVLGQAYRTSPACFAAARAEFAERIDHWGYLDSRRDYLSALARADVFVSTSNHEFFGISAVEAARAGTLPVLPMRLAYPEVFDLDRRPEARDFFYDGSVETLTEHLLWLGGRLHNRRWWNERTALARRIAGRYTWPVLAGDLDRRIARLRAD
ncbi:MAG: DUF3524 domain-containing protein [Phycisphaerae bacterium]